MSDLVGTKIVGFLTLIYNNFRYDYEDPDFEMVRNFTNVFVSGQGPTSPYNFFPEWMVKLMQRKVSLSYFLVKLIVNF